MKEQVIKETWNKKFFIISAIIVVLTLSVCITLAFFFESKKGDAQFELGAIEIDKEGSFFENNSIANVIAGDSMVSRISFKKTARSESMFVRLTAYYHSEDDGVARIAEWVQTLNIMEIPNLSSVTGEYAWSGKQADGYYYLMNNDASNTMYSLDSTTEIVFAESIKMPIDFNQSYEVNGVIYTYNKDIKINIVVEAIQSSYLGVGNNQIATIKPLFSTKVKKGFSVEWGETNTHAEVDFSNFSVGQEIPTITDGDYELVWFIDQNCYDDPLYFRDKTIRYGSNYYVTWVYAGTANYVFSANKVTGYNGNEKRLIFPKSYGGYTINTVSRLVNNTTKFIRNIILPEGYTTIENDAFSTLNYVCTLDLPNTLVSIGGNILGTYNHVLSLVIPESVTTISANALKPYSLKHVEILGLNISTLNATVFYSGSPFLEIIVPDVNFYKQGNWVSFPIYAQNHYTFYEINNIYYTSTGASTASAVAIRGHVTNIVVPGTVVLDGVTKTVNKVENNFNSYNYYPTSIVISPNITVLGSLAFCHTRSCTSLTFPNGLTTIQSSCFDGVGAVPNVVIPASVTSIIGGAFSYSSIKKVTFLGRVTSLSACFYSTSSLTNAYVQSADLSYYQTILNTNYGYTFTISAIS